MEPAHLAAFNLTLLATLLIALRTSVVEGRRAGRVLGAGLGIAAALWTPLALLGLDAVFTIFPWACAALKTAGALYLLWLAVAIWRDAQRPVAQEAPLRHPGPLLRGILGNLGNPNPMLFAASVLVVIFPRDLTPGDTAIIAANLMIVEWLACGGFVLLLSTPRARAGYFRLKPVFDRIAAGVLAGPGLRLLAHQPRKEIR